jgi:hypothetical protein
MQAQAPQDFAARSSAASIFENGDIYTGRKVAPKIFRELHLGELSIIVTNHAAHETDHDGGDSSSGADPSAAGRNQKAQKTRVA